MEHSGSTQVIRQGTFDTDPASALRSKSGGVTRGAVILPVITDQEPPRSLPVITDQDSSLKSRDFSKAYQAIPVTPIIREGTYDDGFDFSKPEKESLKPSKASNKNNNNVKERDRNSVQSDKKLSVVERNVRKKRTQEDAIEPKFGQKQIDTANNPVVVEKVRPSETEKLKFSDSQKIRSIDKTRKQGLAVQSDNDLSTEEFELTVEEDNVLQADAKRHSTPVDTTKQYTTSNSLPGRVSVESITPPDTQANKPRRFTKSTNNKQESKHSKSPVNSTITTGVAAKDHQSVKQLSDSNATESDSDYPTQGQTPTSTAYFDQPGFNIVMEPSRDRHPGSERMVETYESVYKERQSLLNAEVAYKKRIKQLEDEANQFLRSIEQLRDENNELRNRVDELENDDGPQKVTNHQSKSTVVINSDTDELILKMKLLEQENQKLTSKVQETDGMVKSLLTKNSQLEKENIELKNLSKHNEAKHEKLEKDNKEKETQLAAAEANNSTANLEKELAEMKSQLEEASRAEEQQTKEIMEMKTTEKAMKNEVATLKRENKEMRMEIEKYKEAAKEGENEEKDGPLTARDKMELKSQIISLQTENQKLNEENIKLKAEGLEQVKKVHDLEKAAKSYESSVTAVESEKLSQIQSIQNENEKLKNEIASIKESHKDSDSKIKALEAENKATSTALNQKKAELDELMKALSGENLEDEIQGLKTEKETLLNKIKEQESNIKESQKLLEETKIQRDQLESEKKKIAKELSDASKSNDSLKAEIEQLKSDQSKQNKDLEKEKKNANLLSKREKELEEAKTACDKYQKELENMKNEKQKEQENFKKKMQELNREKQIEVNSLKEQLDSQKAQLETLKVSAIDVKEVEELRQELRTIYNKHSQMTIELEQKDRIETRAFEMTIRIDQLNAKIKQLEQEKRDWMVEKEHFSEIDASNKRLTEENTRLKKLLEMKGEMDQNNNGDLTHRINKLERLHKDAATRVRQLEGWVGEPDGTVRRPTNLSRQTHKSQKPYNRSPPKQRSRAPIDQLRIQLEEEPVRSRSAENPVEEEVRHTPTPPLSLPPIYPESSKRGFYGPGYSQIHKNRIQAASKRRV